MNVASEPTVRDVALRLAHDYPARLRRIVIAMSVALVIVGSAICMALQVSSPALTAADLLWLVLLLQWCHLRSTATYNPRWPVLSVSAHNVIIITGVFLLPPVLLPILAAGYLVRRPVAWHWRVWNFAAACVALALSAGAWMALRDGDGRSLAVAAALAVIVFWLVESTGANWVNWYADHVTPTASGLWTWRGMALDLAILSLGALAAITVAADPWMLLLAAPAVTVVIAACQALGRAQVTSYDAKTGLLAPHILTTWGAREVELAHRRQTPLTLVMTDIDWFRQVNTNYGHPAGDAALRHVAELLTAASRSTDLAIRYGGEELTLLLPDTGRDEGEAVAERFRSVLETTPAITRAGAIPLTVSAGVAALEPGETLDSLVARADAALYRAKHAGRNRVEVDEHQD